MNMDPEIQAELDQAEAARSAGNEGKARVCARRAAGIAARLYYHRHGVRVESSSAYYLLSTLAEKLDLEDGIRKAARNLTRQVDPDFRLPPGVDLIAEAREVCNKLSSL